MTTEQQSEEEILQILFRFKDHLESTPDSWALLFGKLVILDRSCRTVAKEMSKYYIVKERIR
jgi:hypothetical protein